MNALNRRFTYCFTYCGVVGLALVAVTSCGATVEATVGYTLRDRLSRWPGLAWLDPVTPIAAASQNRGATVYLAGTVERQLSLVDQGLYELADDSGSIWVLSAEASPPVDASVALRATIQYEQILLQGQDIGEYYAEELERLPSE